MRVASQLHVRDDLRSQNLCNIPNHPIEFEDTSPLVTASCPGERCLTIVRTLELTAGLKDSWSGSLLDSVSRFRNHGRR